ncbi:MAG: hypothetical protein E6J14_12030 [Chloroflexi bacterium]|nr:MAG: hypothetical protein E6J14_12030 [Chloroflexota bacterium]
MSAGLWYVAVVCLGGGVGIPAYWLAAAGTVDDAEMRFHVAAEVVTGLVLLAAGIGMVVDHRARWSVALSSLGLGLLLYAVIASPGLYAARGERRMALMFAPLAVFVGAAVILRLVAER